MSFVPSPALLLPLSAPLQGAGSKCVAKSLVSTGPLSPGAAALKPALCQGTAAGTILVSYW